MSDGGSPSKRRKLPNEEIRNENNPHNLETAAGRSPDPSGSIWDLPPIIQEPFEDSESGTLLSPTRISLFTETQATLGLLPSSPVGLCVEERFPAPVFSTVHELVPSEDDGHISVQPHSTDSLSASVVSGLFRPLEDCSSDPIQIPTMAELCTEDNLHPSTDRPHSPPPVLNEIEAGMSEFSEMEFHDCISDRDASGPLSSGMEHETFFDTIQYFTEDYDPCQHDHHTSTPIENASETVSPEDGSESADAEGEGVNCDDNGTSKFDQPLYNGASVTVSDASTAFLSLMMCNDISGELLGRILAFIQLVLPSDNKFFSTLHLFLKPFENVKTALKLIYYCSSCRRGVETKDSVCARCGSKGKIEYYLNLPLIPQIKSLYSNSAFVEALSYRFNRKKLVEENLEDVYDGDVYKSASEILSHPYNISLFWNTDGISLFKSSNFQIWPFYFVVNELPPHLRFKEEYMLLAGLAFGYEKPAGNVFLKPIWEETRDLKRGIEVVLPSSPTPVNVTCIVLCGSCDAPAKSAFLRLTNFNGFNGCPRCLTRGQYDRAGKVFTYPFEENISLRTKEGYQEDLDNVKRGGGKVPVNGVQGPSYMYQIVWSFFMTSTAVDVMHNVYLGVCRQLLFLWLSPVFLKQVFGENVERTTLVQTLSAKLCCLQAPHYMSRPPRSLHNMKFFKASELRTWLFCTGLPILEKTMKEPFLEHFKKLVCAISHLNQTSVSRVDVECGRSLLISFVKEFQVLFGLRNMSFNVHCLLHLCDVTLALGPLWVSSCFGFENLNGRLARLVHGTRHAGLQMHAHLHLLRNLHSMTCSVTNDAVQEFCKRMVFKSSQYKIGEKVTKGIFVIGKYVEEHVLPPDFNDSLCRSSNVGAKFLFFFRLKRYNFLYVAEDYERGSRDSSYVKYVSVSNSVMYGRVKVFVKVNNCLNCHVHCEHNVSFYALVNCLNTSVHFTATDPYPVPLSSLLRCEATNIINLVPIENLECVCFKIQVDDAMFLSVPLNQYELE